MPNATKVCTKCAIDKPAEDFYKDARRKSGLYSHCKECFTAHCRATHDPEKTYKRARCWTEERGGRQVTKARVEAWRAANPERWAVLNRENANRRRSSDGTQVDFGLILEEHGMTCHICREEIPSLYVLHFDHVIPLSKGGAHSMANIKPSHARCNLSKGAKLIA